MRHDSLLPAEFRLTTLHLACVVCVMRDLRKFTTSLRCFLCINYCTSRTKAAGHRSQRPPPRRFRGSVPRHSRPRRFSGGEPTPVTLQKDVFGGPAGPRAALPTGRSQAPPVAPLWTVVSGRSHPKPPAALVLEVQYLVLRAFS